MEYSINENNILISTTTLIHAKIPENVVGIGLETTWNVFNSSKKTLKTLEFMGDKITYIGKLSFEGCTKLQSVDLSKLNSLSRILVGAFWGCTGISSLSFPTSNCLKELGDNCFRDANLEQLIDLTPFNFVFYNAFLGTRCSYTCGPNHALFREYEGNIYSLNLDTLMFVSYSSQKLILPKETKIFGPCCLTSTSLKEYVVPDQIVEYGSFVFHHTNHLESIVLGKNAPIIRKLIFENRFLKHVQIPEGITTCVENSICENPVLESIKFPSTLTDIPNNSFTCPNLYYATFSSEEQKDKLIKGGIPRRAFARGCKTLNERTIFIGRKLTLALFLGFLITQD